mgnify:CR=1 FL=1
MSEKRRSPYLVSPAYDWAFFLLPPLISLVIGILISGTSFAERELVFAGHNTTAAKLLLGTIVHAHLVAVLFRSHGNSAIRRQHPLRFFVIPVLLFIIIRASDWIGVTATIVVTWWDVWHSGAQTFGFGRIYDRNAGNLPEQGRRLDYWLSHDSVLNRDLLAIVRRLCELYGWKVSLAPRPQGGATATLEFAPPR